MQMDTESKQMTFEEAADRGMVQLLIIDASGIYIPREFARGGYRLTRESAKELADDMSTCAAGPDQEWYWDAWINILDHAVLTDGLPEGEASEWTLYQDGDLWAIRADADIDPESY